MGLTIDTSNLIVKKKPLHQAATKSGSDSLTSVFSLDNLKEHKTELAIAGGIVTAGLIGFSLLTRKRIQKTLSPELLKSWATSTEPLTKNEIKIAQKELESFVNGLQLRTISKKIKVKLIDTSGQAGGVATPIANEVVVNKAILTDKYAKALDENGKIFFFELCGEGTNTQYPIIDTMEEVVASGIPKEFIKPLTKLERLNFAKSLAAHEAFHQSQFRRMLLHPGIGPEKVIEFLKIQNPTLTKEQIQKVITNKNINIFKRLLLKGCPNLTIKASNRINIASASRNWKDLLKQEPINPKSEIGKQTMYEYTEHKHFLDNRPSNPLEYYQAYLSDPIELGAYRFQSKIIKDYNLIS